MTGGDASPAGSRSRWIVVFARAPILGTVKTRLAADVGDAAALDIYRRLGAHAVRAACGVADARVVVQHTPADGAPVIREWLGPLADRLSMHPQRAGDLGERMAGAIADALDSGARQVVVIGTDCPSMDAEVIGRAFGMLDTADVVLGPAHDGGYYLIAVRAAHPALFTEIPWSASDTFARTMDAARRAALRVALLDARADIDSGADWVRWHGDHAGARPSVSG